MDATPELLRAARDFRPYSILEADVTRSVEVARAVVAGPGRPASGEYQLLSAEWMGAVFADCDKRLSVWLRTWRMLAADGAPARSADIRAAAGLPSPTPDTWAG